MRDLAIKRPRRREKRRGERRSVGVPNKLIKTNQLIHFTHPGARALAAALKETKLATLDLSKNYMIGTDGTKALAAFCAVSSTLTELSLKENELGDEGVVAIRDALAANKACKLEKLNLWKNRIGADGANALTAFCAANATLRRIHLGANALGRKGKAALREVAEQKNREVVAARGERFELKLRHRDCTHLSVSRWRRRHRRRRSLTLSCGATM